MPTLTAASLASALVHSEGAHEKPGLAAWLKRHHRQVEQACAQGIADREKDRAAFDAVELRAINLRNAIESYNSVPGGAIAVLPDPYADNGRVPDTVRFYRNHLYAEIARKLETEAANALRGHHLKNDAKLPVTNRGQAEVVAAYVARGRFALMAMEGANAHRQRSGHDAWDMANDLFYSPPFNNPEMYGLVVLWELARLPLRVDFFPPRASLRDVAPARTWVTAYALDYCKVPNTVARTLADFNRAIPGASQYDTGIMQDMLSVRRGGPYQPGGTLGGRAVVVVPRISYVPTVGYHIDFEFCTYALNRTNIAGNKGEVVFDITKVPSLDAHSRAIRTGAEGFLFRDYSRLILPEYGPPIDTSTGTPVGPHAVDFADRYTTHAGLIDAPCCVVRTPLTSEFLGIVEKLWPGHTEKMLTAAGFKEAKKPLTSAVGAKAYHVTEWGRIDIRIPSDGKR